jgi:hypothetical protein
MRQPHRRAIPLVFVPLILVAMTDTRPVAAQPAAAAQEAERAVRAFFDDIAAERWLAAAERFDGDALERFRAAQLQMLSARETTADHVPRYADDMPEAVRDWFEAQRAASPVAHLEFAGMAALDDIHALTAAELMARRLEAQDPRTHLRQAAEEAGRAGPMPPPLDRLRERRSVVGSVVEDDSTVQVLYRVVMDPFDEGEGRVFESLGVVTVRRAASGWRLAPSDASAAADRFFTDFAFSFNFELPGDRIRRLDELADRVFAWPEGAPQVRASVAGYDTPGHPPRGFTLELPDAQGRAVRVELPYDALQPLFDYLEPWMWLSEPEG